MIERRSLRFRLTLWYAVVLSAALAVFGGLVWLSLRQRMLSEFNEDLEGRAARFEKYFRSESLIASDAHLRNELDEFCQALPSGSTVMLTGTDGFTFRYMDTPPHHPSQVRTLEQSFRLNDQTYRLEVGAPAGGMLHTIQLVESLLVGLLPVVIAIACLGGAWLSRRALKPVQDISNAALTIGIENLSHRLSVPPTGDELAHLTEVLNTMFQRLESAVKTLSQFAADASHELRTPLAVIQTTADLALRRARTPESYRQSLEEVTEEAQRMTRIVEDLLALARGDAAVLDLPLTPLDVRDLLRDLTAETHNLAEARQIGVDTQLGEEPAIISGNRPALHRLFLALVDNALKYSRPGGNIALTIDRRSSRVAVEVRDHGPGIPPSDLPHIFKRFYRADRSCSGHGLGLALAESLARAHGAAIEVENPLDGGALFRVVFPVREMSPSVLRTAKV